MITFTLTSFTLGKKTNKQASSVRYALANLRFFLMWEFECQFQSRIIVRGFDTQRPHWPILMWLMYSSPLLMFVETMLPRRAHRFPYTTPLSFMLRIDNNDRWSQGISSIHYWQNWCCNGSRQCRWNCHSWIPFPLYCGICFFLLRVVTASLEPLLHLVPIFTRVGLLLLSSTMSSCTLLLFAGPHAHLFDFFVGMENVRGQSINHGHLRQKNDSHILCCVGVNMHKLPSSTHDA